MSSQFCILTIPAFEVTGPRLVETFHAFSFLTQKQTLVATANEIFCSHSWCTPCARRGDILKDAQALRLKNVAIGHCTKRLFFFLSWSHSPGRKEGNMERKYQWSALSVFWQEKIEEFITNYFKKFLSRAFYEPMCMKNWHNLTASHWWRGCFSKARETSLCDVFNFGECLLLLHRLNTL